jgi:hypothetical protein
MTTDPRFLSLEVRIDNAIQKDGLHKLDFIVSKPRELMDIWGRFLEVYAPTGKEVKEFWDNVFKLDQLDAYDAGRCIYALTLAVDSVTATPSEPDTVDLLYRLANTLGTTASWSRKPSYASIQRAAGENVMTMFADPAAYIETIINAVSPMQHR